MTTTSPVLISRETGLRIDAALLPGPLNSRTVSRSAGRRCLPTRSGPVTSVPDPLMECLDCADPSIMTPKRNTTLTSLQALALLNNPLSVRQAERLADRLRAEHSDTASQIDALYRLALGRPPGDEERQELVDYAAQYGLANACRVILNSNEFVFVD